MPGPGMVPRHQSLNPVWLLRVCTFSAWGSGDKLSGWSCVTPAADEIEKSFDDAHVGDFDLPTARSPECQKEHGAQ
jgi:hypothetical protein